LTPHVVRFLWYHTVSLRAPRHPPSDRNPGGLDGKYAHKRSLVWNPANETFYLFYCAVGDQGRGIGLITSKPLEG